MEMYKADHWLRHTLAQSAKRGSLLNTCNCNFIKTYQLFFGLHIYCFEVGAGEASEGVFSYCVPKSVHSASGLNAPRPPALSALDLHGNFPTAC
jgi:hypothetical protein